MTKWYETDFRTLSCVKCKMITTWKRVSKINSKYGSALFQCFKCNDIQRMTLPMTLTQESIS